jgi:hypothetical protein
MAGQRPGGQRFPSRSRGPRSSGRCVPRFGCGDTFAAASSASGVYCACEDDPLATAHQAVVGS